MRGLGKLALPARFVRIKGCEKRKPATGPARIKGFEICEPATGPARMKNCERFHCFINSKRAEWAARDMGIHQARPHQRLGETQVPHRARPDERLREHPIRTPAAIAGSIPTEEGGIAADRRGRDAATTELRYRGPKIRGNGKCGELRAQSQSRKKGIRNLEPKPLNPG